MMSPLKLKKHLLSPLQKKSRLSKPIGFIYILEKMINVDKGEAAMAGAFWSGVHGVPTSVKEKDLTPDFR